MLRIPALLIAMVVAMATSYGTPAATTVDTASPTFVAGLRAYEGGHYDEAVRLLSAAMVIEPTCARCAHLLGRSYGRLAERARGLRALGLARKTCDALELAVQLDPDEPSALEDLIRYYRAAPGFLGGSVEKARQLEQRLRGFDSDTNT